tara:strand:- start:3 stop:269 length:267 start_codon:yes stop_codon:yes gene_type:complete
MIHDLCKGYCNGSPGFFSTSFTAPLLVTQPERLFFTANPSVEGRELWIVESTNLNAGKYFKSERERVQSRIWKAHISSILKQPKQVFF